MTQQQFADRAGLKLGGIRDLEQERNKPTWETVLALCGALNVDPNAFAQAPAQPSDGKPKRGRPRKPGQVEDEADRAFKENLAELERRAIAALEGAQAEGGEEPPVVKKRGGKRKGRRPFA
jgi:transcriptional regulator with XRE-family HTH domain